MDPISGIASASAPPSVARPDLYIDGVALADRVSAWALANTDAQTRLDHHFWPGALLRLYEGEPFFAEDDARTLALFNWLMAQPDNSVTLDAFYQHAIAAAHGEVETGLAIAWDLLSNDGTNKDRNDFPRTRKLVDITGERDAFHGSSCGWMSTTVRGDNFSAWYHMAGTALLTFMNANGILGSSLAELKSRAMVDIEEHGIGDRFIVDMRKRLEIDRAGIALGRTLADNLKNGRVSGDANRAYMYDNADVYGPSWRMPASGKPCDYRDHGANPRNLVTAPPPAGLTLQAPASRAR